MLRLLGFASLLGCSALFAKSEPLSVRYYAPPDRAVTHTASTSQADAARVQQPLRLGRVTASAHLDVRLVSRDASNNELVYQDVLRWTDNPARYLSRGLEHALFEEQAVAQAVSGRALTLEAELLAFEALRGEPTDLVRARVSVVWTLHDERRSRLRETLSVERKLASGARNDPDALVAALSEALDECIDRIASRVVTEVNQSVDSSLARPKARFDIDAGGSAREQNMEPAVSPPVAQP